AAADGRRAEADGAGVGRYDEGAVQGGAAAAASGVGAAYGEGPRRPLAVGGGDVEAVALPAVEAAGFKLEIRGRARCARQGNGQEQEAVEHGLSPVFAACGFAKTCNAASGKQVWDTKPKSDCPVDE